MEKSGSWPSVSVFVAARNEEAHLPICLAALKVQNYPGNWEVLVANDHSEDQTQAIATSFQQSDERFHVFSVPEPDSPVRGKALALAILAEKARGEIFLICDADMQMPENWMLSMVSALQNFGVDLLNGTTTTKGNSLFTALQAVDWLIPQGHFAWLSRLGIAYTAMGNNMAITRTAYEATGGYRNIPFSLTEDFELFIQAQNRGFQLIHYFHPDVLGISTPQNSPSEWLSQHIRWMVGFMQLPFAQQWVFYAQLLFYPLGLLCWLLGWTPAFMAFLVIWALKLAASAILMVQIRRIKFIPFLPVYECIWWFAYATCLVGYVTARNIRWKGRTWKK